MYRAGGPAQSSLPWSRRSIGPWTTALTIAAALAIALPLVADFATASPFEHERRIGIGRAILMCQSIAVPLLLATAGAMLVRGRRVHVGPQLAFALFPFAFTLLMVTGPLIALAMHGQTSPAYSAASAFIEIERDMLFGACAGAAACAVLAMSMIGALATVDRERLEAPPRSPWTAIAVGGVWFVAAFGVRIAHASAFPSSALLACSLLGPLAAGALAAFATWCSGILARTEDGAERRAAFAFIVVAALASAALVLLVDRASEAATMFYGLRALIVTSTDAPTKIASLVEARRAHTVAVGVDIVGCAAVFGIALRNAWAAVPDGASRRDMLRSRGLLVSGLAALVAWLLVVVVSMSASAARAWFARRFEAANGAPGDLELPAIRSDAVRSFPKSTRSISLHADGRSGTLVRPDAQATPQMGTPNVYADRRATFQTIVDSARMARLPTAFAFIARNELSQENREALGDFSAFLPPPEHDIPVHIDFGARANTGCLDYVLDAPPVVRLRYRDRERIASLAGNEDADARRQSYEELVGHETPCVRVMPRPNDTVERIVDVLQCLEPIARDVTLAPLITSAAERKPGGSASSQRGR